MENNSMKPSRLWLHPRVPKKKKKRRSWRLLAMVVVGLLLLPVAQVACIRIIDPPVTPLMLIRKVEGRFSKRYAGAIHYQWVDLERVPRNFLQDVIGLEDARFFQHDGIDWKEVGIARRAEKPRGASTITMQCARSLFLWQGRSYLRKGIEVYYTVLMEMLLPKRRILELYANVIEMGDGVYGVGAAATVHFGKPIERLNPRECALLAAMLPAPRTFDPAAPGPKLRARERKALERGRAVRLPL